MELENFKKSWKQFDTKLNENLKLNEKLLKRLSFGNSKNEMQKLLVTEQLNIAGTFLAFVFFTAYSLRLINEVQYSVPGLIGSALLFAYLSFSVIKVKNLLKINYYDASIVGLQKALSKIKVLVLRFRRIEYLLMPLLMFSLLPITFISIADMNIYENLDKLWLQILLISGFASTIVLVISVNKHFYDRKIRNAEDFLREVSEYEVSE
jgi:putative effector of murein hydrolase LrgA (UPF0299 family)